MRHLRIILACLFWLTTFSFPLCAADPEIILPPVVVFNSFGPGNTFNTTIGWGVSGGSSSGSYRGQAEWFVPGTSGNLSSIQLAMFRGSGSGRSNFYIAQDNSGIPGDILETYPNVLSPNGGWPTVGRTYTLNINLDDIAIKC